MRQLKYNVQPNWSSQIITIYLIGQFKPVKWYDIISLSEMISYHSTGIIFFTALSPWYPHTICNKIYFYHLAPEGLTVADKLAKQVDETYIQKEDDEKEGGDGEKNAGAAASGAKGKRKEKKFVPAAKWALVYRALKPLLRPCGDLGEGRLDFYHRSISKAVRRKWVTLNKNYHQSYCRADSESGAKRGKISLIGLLSSLFDDVSF